MPAQGVRVATATFSRALASRPADPAPRATSIPAPGSIRIIRSGSDTRKTIADGTSCSTRERDSPLDADTSPRTGRGHHASDPKEDDVEAGDEHDDRIEFASSTALVRPSERRERPQREENQVSSTSSSCVSAVAAECFGRALASASLSATNNLSLVPVPGRNPVAPPELARNAPGLDVAHPIEVRRLPMRRDERGLASHRSIAGSPSGSSTYH